MTENIALPANEKRDALRTRIEAAERRNAERNLADKARAAAQDAIDYTRANPLTVVGGAIAAGLVIGLLTRPGRRAAGRALSGAGGAISGAASSASAGVRGIAAQGGSRLGTMIGQAAVAYLMTLIDDMLDAADTAKERVEDLGEAAQDQARKLSADAAGTPGTAAEGTRTLARRTRDAAIGIARDIRRQTRA